MCRFRICLVLLSCWMPVVAAASDRYLPEGLVETFENQWQQMYYQTTGKHRAEAFLNLSKRIHKAIDRYPDSGVLYVAEAVALCAYADAAGPINALQAVKRARAYLEKSLSLDMDVEDQVSAHVVLGALYYLVPKWPIAFGNDDKAKRHLMTALSLDPDNPEANYFYGDFLWRQDAREKAIKYFHRALQSPAKDLAGREIRKKALARLKTYGGVWMTAYKE